MSGRQARIDLNPELTEIVLAPQEWTLTLQPQIVSVEYEVDKILLQLGGVQPSINTPFEIENAQDAVGSILIDSPSINFTYDDSTPSITAVVTLSVSDIPNLPASKITTGTFADNLIPSSIARDTEVQAVIVNHEATRNHPDATNSLPGLMTAANKVKLDGIATGATANSTDAYLLSRANHTGTQAISTVTGLQTALDGKQAVLGYTPADVLAVPGLARSAITLTTSGNSGIASYNSSTGALNIPNYTLAGLGGISSVPWEAPGTIGSTTPNTGVFTTLRLGTTGGPLLRNNSGTVEARVNANNAYANFRGATLTGSAGVINATGTVGGTITFNSAGQNYTKTPELIFVNQDNTKAPFFFGIGGASFSNGQPGDFTYWNSAIGWGYNNTSSDSYVPSEPSYAFNLESYFQIDQTKGFCFEWNLGGKANSGDTTGFRTLAHACNRTSPGTWCDWAFGVSSTAAFKISSATDINDVKFYVDGTGSFRAYGASQVTTDLTVNRLFLGYGQANAPLLKFNTGTASIDLRNNADDAFAPLRLGALTATSGSVTGLLTVSSPSGSSGTLQSWSSSIVGLSVDFDHFGNGNLYHTTTNNYWYNIKTGGSTRLTLKNTGELNLTAAIASTSISTGTFVLTNSNAGIGLTGNINAGGYIAGVDLYPGGNTGPIINVSGGVVRVRNNANNADSSLSASTVTVSTAVAFTGGAAATTRTNLGLGSLATISPTGTANSTTYLRGDGSWQTVIGGATPGGTDTQVQFNDGGSALGGDSGFTYNKTTNTLTIDNLLSALTMVVPSFAPASNTAAGTTGQITWDANYLYQCVATNTWKRIEWSSDTWGDGIIPMLWGSVF